MIRETRHEEDPWRGSVDRTYEDGKLVSETRHEKDNWRGSVDRTYEDGKLVSETRHEKDNWRGSVDRTYNTSGERISETRHEKDLWRGPVDRTYYEKSGSSSSSSSYGGGSSGGGSSGGSSGGGGGDKTGFSSLIWLLILISGCTYMFDKTGKRLESEREMIYALESGSTENEYEGPILRIEGNPVMGPNRIINPLDYNRMKLEEERKREYNIDDQTIREQRERRERQRENHETIKDSDFIKDSDLESKVDSSALPNIYGDATLDEIKAYPDVYERFMKKQRYTYDELCKISSEKLYVVNRTPLSYVFLRELDKEERGKYEEMGFVFDESH